jgi:hypothetical protein
MAISTRTHKPTPTLHCAPFAKLDQEFAVDHYCMIPSHVKDAYVAPAHKFLLVNGNLHLEHDLNLDWGPFEASFGKSAREVRGLIVIGNLTIDGDLLNTDIDSGPLLLTRGNLTANNLRSGGGSIIIGGDASIRDVVFGNYNHGELFILRDLYAGLLVMRNHCFGAHRIRASHVVDDATDLGPGSDDAQENLRRFQEHLEAAVDDVEELAADLEEGKPILKAYSRNTHVLRPTAFPTTREEATLFVHNQERLLRGDLPLHLYQDQDFMLSICSMHPGVFGILGNGWHLSPEFMHAGIVAGSPDVSEYIRFVEDPSIRAQLLDRVSRTAQ